MPVEDILNERNDGRNERDVRQFPSSAFDAGGDVPEAAKADGPLEERRGREAQENDRAPLRNNPLRGRVQAKGDGNTALSLFNTVTGLL